MNEIKICVVGLGYVGLPLACLFSKKYTVIGYDINQGRVNRIMQGIDDSNDIEKDKLLNALANGMLCTTNLDLIGDCNVYIVAVPTPVDNAHNPILTPLEGASKSVGKHLKKGDYVIYESTVYPGTTEEVCLPILENESSLICNKDFFIGYSPERINPGDKEHTVENIVKITSGSTPEAAEFVDDLYNTVLTNGTYKAQSIQVAEAAKVIENTQRDINIAFVNEIAKVFNALNINTNDVLEAAGTKWNFLKFTPGLVGGHCISVDPYYLIRRSMLKGFTPTLMREARSINDTMGYYVAERTVSELIRRNNMVKEADVLIFGYSFKPNCKDVRNTKVVDVYQSLQSHGINVEIFDPIVDIENVRSHSPISIHGNLEAIKDKTYNAIIQCVNHSAFEYIDIADMLKENGFVLYINRPRSRGVTRCDVIYL